MTFVPFPARSIGRIDWTLPEAATFVVKSGWTATRTTGDLGGVRAGWTAKVVIVPQTILQLETWRGWMAAMRGVVGTTTVGATEVAQSTLTGNVTVDGAGQVGAALATAGWPAGVVALHAGQLASVGGRLFVVTAIATSDAAGKAVLALFPALTTAPAAGAAVEFRNPACTMALTNPQLGWSVAPGRIYTPATFVLEEAL